MTEEEMDDEQAVDIISDILADFDTEKAKLIAVTALVKAEEVRG